ncbi:endonuclease/exonuclease/phosphatase family protein [Chthonobacter rhizosphaerae]|uniref:endonuclease/exonuclease/phosphatase family protein n=1 Tax=Chthonobacter rhizosphaerae TaxID=2735553 RepID=UPI0015EF308A|nr:endonuclease/exonuclease/phosphatase family protein [Chthonobacter rhizosphaerae]
MKLGPWLDLNSLLLVVCGLAALYGAAVWFRTADLVLFFLPYVLVATTVAAVLFLTWRRRHLILLTLLAIASVAVIPVWAERTADGTGTPIAVATVNTLADKNGDKQGFAAWLRSTPADIVLLQEVSSWSAGLMREARAYPVRVGPVDGHVGILSRYPLVGEPRLFSDGAFSPRHRLIRAEFDVTDPAKPGAARRTMVVYALHAQTPRSKLRWLERNRLLAVLAEQVSKEAPGTAIVVGGDFNTPPWSPWLHKLLATTPLTLADKSLWPAATRYFREFGWPEFFGSTVDHILVSPEVRILGHRVGPNVGSDHLPVTASILLN